MGVMSTPEPRAMGAKWLRVGGDVVLVAFDVVHIDVRNPVTLGHVLAPVHTSMSKPWASTPMKALVKAASAA